MRVVRYDKARPSKEQRRAFSCGEPSLDRWLATQARQSMESRDAVTYLLLDDEDDQERIAGYFCLSGGQVELEAAPTEVSRRAPDPIPVIRMGRFAVHQDYQGQGWGADLLREALLSAVEGSVSSSEFVLCSSTQSANRPLSSTSGSDSNGHRSIRCSTSTTSES